jgi:hypothetical protein
VEVGAEHVREGCKLQGVEISAVPLQGNEVVGEVGGHEARLEA